MLGTDALRLVAALTHTMPSVSALLRLDHGPQVVVGSDRRCLPDLSPCEVRRLVGDHRHLGRGATGPELTWLASVVAIEVGGPEVTEVVEDVVRVGGRDEPVAAFATLLDPLSTRAVLRDVGHDLLTTGAADAELLRSLRASTFHDEVVGATTVVVASPSGAGEDVRTVVLAASRGCRVTELVESVTATR
ncbi:hypothetical protein HC251_15895 [Iamia sp. SCSIO 61187]|uniref:hypothetical protein n=1 Tax=Iamia sp. SCSIO 61187 TaxID=2722752 RepID=UPI001C62D821|nr:hypothetical protein [Iamia sp. SCSIO 61187]QYG93762.1 hypothetical protein HC251_15895 [Iamia sp. SCSIO 61187]